MARAEEKQGFTSTYSQIREEGGGEVHHDLDDQIVSSSGCCCFGFGGWRKPNQESNYLLQEKNRVHKESWVVNKLNQLKEFSEVVAGPKWKNLVRKIGKYLKPKKSRNHPMYSPQSYALNFADGDEEEDEDFLVSFSSRFSAPVSTNQQKMAGSS